MVQYIKGQRIWWLGHVGRMVEQSYTKRAPLEEKEERRREKTEEEMAAGGNNRSENAVRNEESVTE
jgi:hypothetical protein